MTPRGSGTKQLVNGKKINVSNTDKHKDKHLFVKRKGRR